MNNNGRQVTVYVTQGLGGIALGVVLITLKGMALLPGIIVGLILGYTGFVLLKGAKHRAVGLLIIASGMVTILASIPSLGKIPRILMLLGGIGLILNGIWTSVKSVFRKANPD